MGGTGFVDRCPCDRASQGKIKTDSLITMHMATLNRLIVVALLALLAGCGTPVARNATTAELDKKAVIVFSISHDIEFQAGAKAIVYMDDQDLGNRAVLTSVQDVLSVPVSSDFIDRRGHLYVLEVKPGRHKFDGWHISSAGARISRSAPAEDLQFEVHEGEALYLGNIHTQLVDGHWVLGGRSARGGFPLVVDRRDQDVPLAEEKVPALKGRLRPSLLTLGPWGRTSGNATRFDPIYVPSPVK